MMRVLYLMPQPTRGDRLAAYSFLDEEVQGLAAAGIEPFVLSVRRDSQPRIGAATVCQVPADKSVRERAASCRFLARAADLVPKANLLNPRKAYRPIQAERVAAEIVSRERIDLIHSHFGWPAGFGGMLARRVTGVPLVASLRGTDVLVDPSIGYGRRSEPDFDRAIRRLLTHVDRTICFSGFMRDHIVSLGADPARARVVRKGVDLRQFQPSDDRAALKARLGLADAPLVLSVGGLIPRKGVDLTLDALATLAPRLPFTFVVCGDGPELERLTGHARDRGLSARARFVGRVSRDVMPHYFAAADVLVHAPALEAAGNVLFEAMASGRPVICTRSGGPEEYVEDGITGFVVPAGDAATLAARIEQVLTDHDRREALGRAALMRARDVFTFERMTHDIVRVYDEALAGRQERTVA